MKKFLVAIVGLMLGHASGPYLWAAQPPGISWDGYELFSYLSSKHSVDWIRRFRDLEEKRQGVLVVLGDQNTLPWDRIRAWVKNGGSLLVASDGKPHPLMENAVAELTGHQWAGIVLKSPNSLALDGLPGYNFEGNQFVIPGAWRKPVTGFPGLANLFGESPSQKVYLNTPTFLLRARGSADAQILGRFPNRNIMVTEVGEGPLPLPAPPFAVMARPSGAGTILQLSNTRVFSNQMLELRENAEFAWWTLEKLLKPSEGETPAPMPFMMVVAGQVVEPFQLPSAPLPLPDLDPITALSLGARALDEALPQWENRDGPITRFSERIGAGNLLAKVLTFLAVLLGVFGIYQVFRMRGRLRNRELSEPSTSTAPPEERKTPVADRERMMIDLRLEEILMEAGIPLWLFKEVRWEIEPGPNGKKDAREWESCKSEILAWIGASETQRARLHPKALRRLHDRLETVAKLLKKREIKGTRLRAAIGEKTA